MACKMKKIEHKEQALEIKKAKIEMMVSFLYSKRDSMLRLMQVK
jgi:hypothetical protein